MAHEQILTAPKDYKDTAYAQRRRAPRYEMALPIALQTEDGAIAATTTRTVSARGLLLVLDHELPAGAAVNFTMTLPAEVTLDKPTQVTGEGHVLRSVHGPNITPTGAAVWHVTITVDRYKFLAPVARPSSARRRSA